MAGYVASMRPRFMNRGSLGIVMPQITNTFASMRPRFMNRGSAAPSSKCQPLRRASMRPRFMNRGSCQADPLGTLPRLCFNEAPIHESGKCIPSAPARHAMPALQ